MAYNQSDAFCNAVSSFLLLEPLFRVYWLKSSYSNKYWRIFIFISGLRSLGSSGISRLLDSYPRQRNPN